MGKAPVVLVADDDRSLRNAIEIILSGMGMSCCKAQDGEEALRLFAECQPDLVILDIAMPKLDGYAVCERIRKVDAGIPVLFLSAKGEIADKRMGFRLGADDYLVKPFSGEELQLRVAALLRRAGITRSGKYPSRPDHFHSGPLDVNLRTGDVFLDGSKVDLTPKESRIVALLAESPNEMFSKEDIIRAVWGEEYLGTAISISTYIRRIRAKLEKDPGNPRFIQTVRCQGYRMVSS